MMGTDKTRCWRLLAPRALAASSVDDRIVASVFAGASSRMASTSPPGSAYGAAAPPCIRSSSPTVPRMMTRRWCAALAPFHAPRRCPRREAPGASRLRAKLANLSVGLFLNPSHVILKMPFDLSHAHTFPATEGDNVGGGLKVLLDQDHRFNEIFAAGHRCLLFGFDHLILVWR
jgi:hypothetical protein